MATCREPFTLLSRSPGPTRPVPGRVWYEETSLIYARP